MTTYTVIDQSSGEVIDSGLTAVEAMELILTDDGHEYEIREVEPGLFQLWTSIHSRASTAYNGLTSSVVFGADRKDIARKVISADWRRKPTAMTDESYKRMLADLAADEAAADA